MGCFLIAAVIACIVTEADGLLVTEHRYVAYSIECKNGPGCLSVSWSVRSGLPMQVQFEARKRWPLIGA